MGSVYKITDGDLNYYGSSETTLTRRLTAHKAPTNKCSTNKMNRDNLTIEEVEFCEDTRDLKKRETWWIENNECININKPFRTREEKLERHKVAGKKYYEANKQKCMEANKRARDRPYSCPCGSNIKFGEKTRHHKSKKHINWLTLAPVSV